ncbi:hypothetical protein ATN83_1623 [Raoultella ornithinolytica]|nr:hypothetical protein ATN83_1623 [Raoultella ornithinolytica]KDV92622.1 hypothetical protein AB00_3269 [Raoultella ornithinolytica 2-156-04_S1_C1]KDX13347.1 hypothetical protein AB28_3274 [Raoultella ornithinolytica 2-156-04_S1_C2]
MPNSECCGKRKYPDIHARLFLIQNPTLIATRLRRLGCA